MTKMKYGRTREEMSDEKITGAAQNQVEMRLLTRRNLYK